MRFYFAYGSNMDQHQMKERCPQSLLLGKAVLPEYKIDFTIFSPKRNCGCADIVKSPGQEVWGLLYEVSESNIKALDAFEGHPFHYERVEVEVTDSSKRKYIVDTYQVATKAIEFQKPSTHYLNLIKKASVDFDFPTSYQLYLSAIETRD